MVGKNVKIRTLGCPKSDLLHGWDIVENQDS